MQKLLNVMAEAKGQTTDVQQEQTETIYPTPECVSVCALCYILCHDRCPLSDLTRPNLIQREPVKAS
jgi:hypothetical protein